MNTKGFTLIEVLIGLFIAVLASLSVAQVIASTNKVVDAGRKTFIATNLAHEGLELTRQIRDDAWFKVADRTKWMKGSNPELCPDSTTHTYTIDSESARRDSIKPDSQQKLYIQNNSEWTHATVGRPKDSGYSRLMTIDCTHASDLTGPVFVTVTSKVGWTGASGNKDVSLTEQLYNWMP